MLERAVGYLKKNGDKRAYAAFNDPKGGFVKGQYYVYVVGLDGMMFANGGAPGVLAGKNAYDLHDAAGKPLIRELLVYVDYAPDKLLAPLRAEFVKLVFSKQGQELVAREGYVPLTAEQASAALAAVGLGK